MPSHKKTRSKTTFNVKDTSAKKASVLQNNRRSRTPLVAAALSLLLLAAAGFWLFKPFEGTQSTATISSGRTVSIGENYIAYPVELFDNGQARHFEHQAEGATIRYFVLKSADGVIRAAFDACDVCWPDGKGYYQEGDEMVCRSCGRRFASIRINEVKGGCNPAPLERDIQNGQLIIRLDDIVRGKRFFNFS